MVHAEWARELREARKKFADDVASEMTDVKNDLAHVRELLGVLVRRERRAETKTEIAARRLDRMEREKHEADDAEHEANLQEALSSQSKAVKVTMTMTHSMRSSRNVKPGPMDSNGETVASTKKLG